ncbi:hypothetical protein [Microlunatus antarcticus]|uniref:Uncharacterized protein n=1 Tax=Microlunatus antarcticus TaxID=53388 RepID=A0A7W5JY22_9ACTN|nr:hypothetical protein [Microlunatus antarcticus]MBB3328409.1 hypothetical protein [Microlunatus antarcticus]
MGTPIDVTSADGATTAVHAVNTSGGLAVDARSDTGNALRGTSVKGRGVVAASDSDYGLVAFSRAMPGLRADSELGNALEGWAKGGPNGVLGLHAGQGVGTAGRCDAGTGVDGASTTGVGVHGSSQNGDGVVGQGHRGVVGTSTDFQGVYGHSDTNAGVVGESQTFDGVFAVTHNPRAAAVSGHNPGGLAGWFDGNVVVTGDLVLAGADYAENFDAAPSDGVPPGTVVVLDDEGRVQPCTSAYDRRAVGVVSGAGRYRPGVVLDGSTATDHHVSLALMGKVYCLVDATSDPVEVGDMLTTSARPGHAMRVSDTTRAFGAVIGKALAPARGDGALIPVLVTLQ